MKPLMVVACAILLSMGTPASAHRLDEYLQATTISIERGHILVQLRLTPGVAVLPKALARIDTNGDGLISAAEQKTYAEQVLNDLSLSVDGQRLSLQLVSWKYSKLDEMKLGRGDIQLDFIAVAPDRGHRHRLLFVNSHQSRISVYLVNCLVPNHPDIQITEQGRNYVQSRYELDYTQTGVYTTHRSAAWWNNGWWKLGISALFLTGLVGWLLAVAFFMDDYSPTKGKKTSNMELNTHAYNDYIASLFAPTDAALSETLVEMERENIPGINVSPVEGKLLHILALSIGAKRILEIGTLGGYSGIHLARALPNDGKLITLELDPHHAEVSRRNFERAGVEHKTEIRVGPAAETLRQMAASGESLFDLIFIDADKDGYAEYLRLSLPLLREGGLLLGDNTLPDAVLTQEDSGTKRYNAAVALCPELTTIIIPILRQHGMDGLTVSFKRAKA